MYVCEPNTCVMTVSNKWLQSAVTTADNGRDV
jgi:hypothetical protein